MSWEPATTVLVDGQPLDGGQVLEGLTITRGRRGVDEQAAAGYLRLQLLDPGGQLQRLPSDSQVSVEVDGHRLTTDQAVSDVVLGVAAAGATGLEVIHQVTAVGKLARLHRRGQVDGPLPQQLDGQRVAAALEPAYGTTWTRARSWWATSGSWADADADLTWTDAAATPLHVEDGTYQLAATDDEPGDPLAVAQAAALDGLGQLEELADGSVRYTAAEGRTERATATGWLELPAAAVELPGLTAGAHVADLANRVVVGYGDQQTATAENTTDQQDRGGVLEHRVTTTLVDPADAQARADRLLALRQHDLASLEDVHVLLDRLDATQRDQLLALELGDPVRIVGLPPALGAVLSGALESITWTVTRWTARAVLYLSDWSLSEFGLRWGTVDASVAWTDPAADITWTDAQRIATDA